MVALPRAMCYGYVCRPDRERARPGAASPGVSEDPPVAAGGFSRCSCCFGRADARLDAAGVKPRDQVLAGVEDLAGDFQIDGSATVESPLRQDARARDCAHLGVGSSVEPVGIETVQQQPPPTARAKVYLLSMALYGGAD